jgi:hypothetical protein
LNGLLPTAWFMALYNQLLGTGAPAAWPVARLGLLAPAAVAVVGIPLCLRAPRQARHEPHRSRAGVVPHPSGIVDRLLEGTAGSPEARAAYLFVQRAATGSPAHSLIIRLWLALGLALTLVSAAHAWRAAPLGSATPPLLAPAFTLPFFGLVGLRVSAAVPAHLEANWVFRLAGRSRGVDFAAATRAAAIRVILLPLFLLLGIAYLVLLETPAALRLVPLALAVALVTAEALFLRCSKIPFCCRYVPGKSRPFERWPLYLFLLLLYWAILPTVAAWLLRHEVSYWLVMMSLAVSGFALATARRRGSACAAPLLFDEQPPPVVISLGLHS